MSDNLVNGTGDAGGTAPVKDEQLANLKAEMLGIVSQGSGLLWDRRRHAENTLACAWDGQSADGRKRRGALAQEAFPFEGASDMRIRLADMLVNEAVDLGMEAVQGMSIRGVEGGDDGLAARMERLASWIIENKMGDVWADEWRLFLRWLNADSPGRAVFGIYWDRRTALVRRSITADALLAHEYEANGGDAEAAAATVRSMIFDESAENAAVDWLGGFLGDVRPKALRRAVRALRAGETPEVPVPEVVENRPIVRAHRLYEDIFLPINTTDLQSARVVFLREWLTRVELEEREHSMGYRRTFIDKALGHEGVSHLGILAPGSAPSVSAESWNGMSDPVARKGLFEVVTAYFRAANEDGYPAVYHVAFHGSVDEAAHDREILPYDHGKYPFAWASCERTSRALLAPRGIPELVITDQYALKLLNDSFNDHTTIATNPPVKVPANRPDVRFTWGPYSKIREWRAGEISFMSPGAYPVGNDKHREDILLRVGQYFGRPGSASPELVQSRARARAAVVTTVAREVVLQMLSLCQQYFTDDDLARVTGRGRTPVRFTREDIRGRYDLRVSFDSRTSSLEWIRTVGELIGKYLLPLDSAGVLDRAWLVEYFAGMIDPALLGGVRAVQDALRSELNDEDANLTKIINGIEPEMMTDGQNFAARLGRLMDNLRKNPAIASKMDETSRAILDGRVKHLQGMVQQRENALTGKRMAEPVLGE